MFSLKIHVAWFITPHGFGHAARASSVMEALLYLHPDLHFEIYTLVPDWFFAETIPTSCFTWHALRSDIGVVQSAPLAEDLPETARKLAEYLPFSSEKIERTKDSLYYNNCQFAVCDISPMGIAAAHAAGIPAILMENFTWDWIYRGYGESYPDLIPFADQLEQIFCSADYHIQTEPVCLPGNVDLTTPPVSRRPRVSRQATRTNLNISGDARVILLTMGGIPQKYDCLEALFRLKDLFFVIPGGNDRVEQHKNLILLPHHNRFDHPDLVGCVDAVIGKGGYSTIAEVYQAGIPFGMITRDGFVESEKLAEFCLKNMPCRVITTKEFEENTWIERIPEILGIPKTQEKYKNGATIAAEWIVKKLL